MKPSDLVKVKALEWDYWEYEAIGGQYVCFVWGIGMAVWNKGSYWYAEVSHGSENYKSTVRQSKHRSESAAKASCHTALEVMIYQLLEVR